MRWYKIVLSGGQTWDATGDPNALNIKLDIPVAAENAPKAGSYVQIWGIDLQTILTANKFTNQTVEVYGGMQKGLPLANPGQQGLLIRGKIFPALGNWVGTDMTLDLYIPVPVGGPTVPTAANIIHKVPANMKLATPLKQTLQTAFPNFTINVDKISDKLVRAYDQQGFYQTLGQYASFIFNLSKDIIKDKNYLGVHLWVNGKTINAYDGTEKKNGKQIYAVDLIGQPIWTGVKTMQFKTVMRGDIKINDDVTLPKTLATLTSNAALPGANQSNIIQGTFKVQQMRHTGNFRQPDWPSWATTFDCIKSDG